MPSYRLVVSETKNKRDGKFIDILGHFNPSMTPIAFEYDKKKYQDWMGKGALVSEAVKKLVDGNYTYVKYKPGKQETSEKSESPAVEPQTE